MKNRINLDELHSQLCNALETEQGSVRIYDAALRHAAGPGLRRRCQRSLDEARRNEAALLAIIRELGFDPSAEGSCRRAVRNVGDALVAAMERSGSRNQDIVEECMRLADQRERANWELFGQLLSPHRAAAPAAPAPARLGRSNDWLHQAAHVRVARRPAAAAAA